MTEKRDLQWALSLAIDYMTTQYNPPTMGNSEDLRQAAKMLREGGPVVNKRSELFEVIKCEKCKTLNNLDNSKCAKCQSYIFEPIEIVFAQECYTERQKIKIVTERSEATFEGVENE